MNPAPDAARFPDRMRKESHTNIYQADSDLRAPANYLRRLREDLSASGELSLVLFQRDVKAAYRQSILGIFWAFVPPLVFAAGFTLLSNAKVVNFGPTAIAYPAYVMLSVILWQTFQESVRAPMVGLTESQAIMKRLRLPPEAVILSRLLGVLFNFAIKLVLLVAVLLWYRIAVDFSSLLALLPLCGLILFGTFLGLLLAPLAVLFQDFSRGLTVAFGFWMFVTPVVYPLPESGLFATIVRYNPVSSLLVTTRETLLDSELSLLPQCLVMSAVGLVGLLLAWVLYRVSLPYVIERSGA